MPRQNKRNTEDDILKLCDHIRSQSGIRIATPKDYDRLAELIFERTHSSISTSTLKRLMGYLPNTKVTASLSTLDILSRYVGFANFHDFVNSHDKPKDNAISKLELANQIKSIRAQMENLADQLRHIEERL